MNDADDCIFCRIAAETEPASFVYRDADVLAFLDLQPINRGQVLVIPVRHAADLAALDPHTGGRLFEVARATAAALRRSGLRCEGVNLFLADGAAAMQEIFHVHLHVIPRFAGDGFGFRYGVANFVRLDRPVLDEAAAAIRSAWPKSR